MPEGKQANRIVGAATCPLCDHVVDVRITEKNKLYMICAETAGGCGHQLFCRAPAAEKALARRITKWTDRNERLAYLGDEALPRKVKPVPPPEPEPEPDPEPELVEIEPEPEPEPEPDLAPPAPRPQRRPPPRRQAPPAKSAFKPIWEE